MNLQILAKKYFNAFSEKKINILEKLFSSEIILRDWDNLEKIKKNVLKFNARLFKKFPKIKVKPISYSINNTKKIICCEILVILNKKKKN